MSLRNTRALARALTLAAILVVLLAASATIVHAAPLEPTKTLVELKAALDDAGGTLPGYFKTVIKGDAVVDIPCTVVGVTGAPGDVVDPSVELILFESHGPVIDTIGGIAAGMSGSPLYVSIEGEDYLVGAVAYGDWFSLNGFGAATAIEAMADVEALAAPVVRPLGAPVATATGLKQTVVVETDVLKAINAQSAGMLTLKPLSALWIGGISPKSASYREFSTRAKNQGFTVVPLVERQLGNGYEHFETTFTAGSTGVLLAARGDLWVGALGTVTYVNGDKVMMFGHPVTGEGTTAMYLHNGWVDGVWPSSMFPWKLGVPGALRGTIAEDRDAGVLGIVEQFPDEVIVRSRAHRSDTGKSATSTVGLPDVVANSTSPMWWGITPFAATVAANKLFTTWPAKGSAVTSTTVVVTDGTETYTVTRHNVFDDEYSIPWAIGTDVDLIVNAALAVKDAGIYPDVRVLDVALDATMTAARNRATIVGLEVPGGLRHGENTVTVLYHKRGVLPTQTAEVTLAIPADTELVGELVAQAGGADRDGGGEEEFVDEERRTLAQALAALDDVPSNDMLTVSFTPEGAEKPAASTSVRTGTHLFGQVSKSARRITVSSMPAVLRAGGRATLEGTVEGATGGTIEVWARTAGETTESLVATCAINGASAEEPVMDEEEEGGGPGAFSVPVGPLFKTTTFRVVYSGDAQSLPGEATLEVPVSAVVKLSASRTRVARGTPVTLTARVTPGDFGGSVRFQRYTSSGWRTVATVAAPTGTARLRFIPRSAGTYRWRARTVGSTVTTSGTSSVVRIAVR